MSAPGETSDSPTLSHGDVTQLWAKFRAGEVVPCPRDAHGVALSVDGAGKVYRLVCTKCGLASPWFGATAAGIVLRSASDTAFPPNE